MSAKHEMVYIVYIIEAIATIKEFTQGDARTILNDSKTLQACLRKLEKLADACGKLDESTKQAHPEIPWQKIRAFRNVLAHDYIMKIDEVRVMEVIRHELPALYAALYPIYEEKIHDYD